VNFRFLNFRCSICRVTWQLWLIPP